MRIKALYREYNSRDFETSLRAEMAVNHITGKDLCCKSGISYNTYKRRLSDPESMTLGEVQRLKQHIDIDPIQLLKVAGYSTREILEAVREECSTWIKSHG